MVIFHFAEHWHKRVALAYAPHETMHGGRVRNVQDQRTAELKWVSKKWIKRKHTHYGWRLESLSKHPPWKYTRTSDVTRCFPRPVYCTGSRGICGWDSGKQNERIQPGTAADRDGDTLQAINTERTYWAEHVRRTRTDLQNALNKKRTSPISITLLRRIHK